MKLQLNDSANTVITSFETEILLQGRYDEVKGHRDVIYINGLELEYYGRNRSVVSKKDFSKLHNKGAKRQWVNHIDEQEQQWAVGVAADCANPLEHGRVAWSTLDSSGTGGITVWDWNLQKHVDKKDLTPAPTQEAIRVHYAN